MYISSVVILAPLTLTNRSSSRPFSIGLAGASGLSHQQVASPTAVGRSRTQCSPSQYHSTKPWSIQTTTVHSCHEVYFYKCESPPNVHYTACKANTDFKIARSVECLWGGSRPLEMNTYGKLLNTFVWLHFQYQFIIISWNLFCMFQGRIQECWRGDARSVQALMKRFCTGTVTAERQCIEACIDNPSARSAEKFFNLHFSVVWIGSHSTFVLCIALLTGRLSLSKTGHTMGTPHCHSYAVSPHSPCWVNISRVF